MEILTCYCQLTTDQKVCPKYLWQLLSNVENIVIANYYRVITIKMIIMYAFRRFMKREMCLDVSSTHRYLVNLSVNIIKVGVRGGKTKET